MPPLPQNKWDQFRIQLLAQLNSNCGQAGLSTASIERNFFEGWLLMECVLAAESTFPGLNIKINSNFGGIPMVDIGICDNGELCAIELKHIPVLSSNAKSRLYEGKDSTVIKDIHKLGKNGLKKKVLRKVLILYGPAHSNHPNSTPCNVQQRGSLTKVCVMCAMKHLQSLPNCTHITWVDFVLKISCMHLIEISI